MIRCLNPKMDPNALDIAATLLQEGQLVAIPTETVYGLAANATDSAAVARIYATKQRPQFNPLIVHVSGLEQAEQIAEFSETARALAEAFWPGPLTMVLPRKKTGLGAKISDLVTAGLDTIALRMPAHPVAQALLSRLDFPLAAPSANPSGQISPTAANHVVEDLGDKISLVLDGSATAVGIESTILDLTTETSPKILRPGILTLNDFKKHLKVHQNTPKSPQKISKNPETISAPGQLKSHYAPSIPLRMNVTNPLDSEAYLGFGSGEFVRQPDLNLSPSGSLSEAATNLFLFMRKLDNSSAYSGIAVAPIPDEGLGLAINDRLTRASHPNG